MIVRNVILKDLLLSEPVVTNEAEMFQWLPKEHMCILVYLVSKRQDPIN